MDNVGRRGFVGTSGDDDGGRRIRAHSGPPDEWRAARSRIRSRARIATGVATRGGQRLRTIAVNGGDHGAADGARHSLECVRLAYERTLMAWLRTALSLI